MPRRKYNTQLKKFVKRLSAMDRQEFLKKIGAPESQLNNWIYGNSQVASDYVHLINRAATEIATSIVQDLFPGTLINSSLNICFMEKLTTIRVELAKRELQQKDLAQAVGVSDTTISSLVNKQKRRIDLKVASAIANFFGKKISDFAEFQ